MLASEDSGPYGRLVTQRDDDTNSESVRISARNSRLTIIAEERVDVSVEGRARVASGNNQTTIESVDGALLVRVPTGTNVVAGTTSGRIEVRGHAGNLALVSVSGRLSVESAETVDLRSESGMVEVGSSLAECRVRAVAGAVKIGQCGSADIATRTGRIAVRGARGAVTAHCVSGRIQIDLDVASDVDAETVSGRIDVSLPHGTRACRVSPIIDDTPELTEWDCTINSRTLTGRVVVATR